MVPPKLQNRIIGQAKLAYHMSLLLIGYVIDYSKHTHCNPSGGFKFPLNGAQIKDDAKSHSEGTDEN